MSQVKVGSIVTFSAFGRKSAAIVLALRSGEVSHLGANQEPLLTLAMIDPARETGLGKDKNGEFIYPIGRFPNVFIEHDVVHASHEFDEEFLKKHGSSQAEILAQRGHGEWTEFEGDEGETITRLRRTLSAATLGRDDAQTEAAKQRARADLAESNNSKQAGVVEAGVVTEHGLVDMSKADRKQELGGMKKAELRDAAEQHGVTTDDSMTKGEITSALNKQLNKEAKSSDAA
jgi:hypothetical protein